MKLKAPTGFAGPVAGIADSITPDANGFYNSTDYREIQALLAAGWQVVGSVVDGDFVAALTGVNPSASVGVYGTAQLIKPNSGYGSLHIESCDLVFGGTFGSETVTVQIIVTYSDGTTTTITSFTATATGTTAMSLAQIRAMIKQGVSIASISFQSKSSLSGGSSIATLGVNAHGFCR